MKKDIIIKIVFGLLLVFCIYLIVSGLLTKDESAPVENTDTNIYETDLILSENNISLYVGFRSGFGYFDLLGAACQQSHCRKQEKYTCLHITIP